MTTQTIYEYSGAAGARDRAPAPSPPGASAAPHAARRGGPAAATPARKTLRLFICSLLVRSVTASRPHGQT
jgi:hypothetical protein